MEFRKVTAIIRHEVLERVEQELHRLGVDGVSVTKVKGYGEYANFFRSDWLSPYSRIEIFTRKSMAEKIARTIIENAHTGIEGDGIVAVTPVEKLFHIRTKEEANSGAAER